MKIELDDRPGDLLNDSRFCAIRLYPETNEEISKLESMFEYNKQEAENNLHQIYAKAEIIKVNNGSYHHAIIFKR